MGLALPWQDEENRILIENYGKIKIEDLEKLIPNKKRHSIQKMANRMGLKGNPSLAARILCFNNNFFDDVNEISAYWAGFLAADGNINKYNDVHISLSSKDEQHLYKLYQRLSYNGKICRYKVKNKTGQLLSYSSFVIYGAHNISKQLKDKYCIVPNKTNILSPPNISDKYILNYIRGYFDGDGTLYRVTNSRALYWGICANRVMIEWLRKQVLTTWELNYPYICPPKLTIHKNGISNINYAIGCKHQKAKLICNILDRVSVTELLYRKTYEYFEKS